MFTPQVTFVAFVATSHSIYSSVKHTVDVMLSMSSTMGLMQNKTDLNKARE